MISNALPELLHDFHVRMVSASVLVTKQVESDGASNVLEVTKVTFDSFDARRGQIKFAIVTV